MVAAYQEMVAEMRTAGSGGSRGSLRASGDGARGRGDEELRDLQRKYSELRSMYNALALKQPR